MSFLALVGYSALVILILMVSTWLLSLILKNTSIVDIIWGFGFVLVNWFAFILMEADSIRSWILAILVTIWGLRLTVYILIRNAGKGEDFRYAAWRKEHGSKWWWYSFFQTFLLQGSLMWIVSLPLMATHFFPDGPWTGVLITLGIILWIFGFFFESMGDLQLARFKKNSENKGKLLTTGVWRYTRHPNYFGDAAQWWAFFLFALAGGAFWTVISPIVMTFLLVKVSGVALLEKSLSKQKPGYEEYVRQTSAFIPWFPKK